MNLLSEKLIVNNGDGTDVQQYGKEGDIGVTEFVKLFKSWNLSEFTGLGNQRNIVLKSVLRI